ncbi:dockerin type I repeat-containing protein [Ruminococcus flavefaciens]|uniref:endo-1,4-beta-xylanase n=1 Tax=Ruminococcus flavefaciens 007c TaxID=1341157 RepID=W7V116_RUMFL|nr:glycoside hydrolase family 11 protein [Ruminococcus flavefaciens]EWM54497.1 hypothetical protein RF007C_01755 [Ruminococcus flavefaciens 007c]
MSLRLFKRAASVSTAILCLAAAVPSVPFKASAEQSRVISSDGYDYEYWMQNSDDEFKFELDGSGGFEASWNAADNCFFSKGLINSRPSSDNYSVSYDMSLAYKPEESCDDACVYVCAYGTLTDPPAVFFFTDCASDRSSYIGENSGFENLGIFDSNGNTYELYYKKDVENSIHGSYSYDRFVSLRRGCEINDNYAELEGNINVKAQLDAFNKLGKKTGTLDSLSLNLESYNCSGFAILNRCEITELSGEAGDAPYASGGTFEKNGYTYSYRSSCEPDNVDFKLYDVDDDTDMDFGFSWKEGESSLTKSLLSAPVKADANSILIFKKDYEYAFCGDKDDIANAFDNILELDIENEQTVYFASVKNNSGSYVRYLTDKYLEKGIDARIIAGDVNNEIALDNDKERIRMYVYPVEYTVTSNENEEKKHTDYWLMKDENYYITDNSVHHTGALADLSKALKELKAYGLDAETVYSASYTFGTEKLAGSLNVKELSIESTDFPNGPFYYDYHYFNKHDFSLESSDQAFFGLKWRDDIQGYCSAEAGMSFEEDGLDLSDVERIAVDYSGSLEYSKNDDNADALTGICIYGSLPVSENEADEMCIVLEGMYDYGESTDSPRTVLSINDNGKWYDISRDTAYSGDGGDESADIDSAEIVYQFSSREHDHRTESGEPLKFSGTIDLTKHIEAYRETNPKLNTAVHLCKLDNIAIRADASGSEGRAVIDKFEVTIEYRDGTVENYNPYRVKMFMPWEVTGDLNGDKIIDSLDVALCRRELLRSENGEEFNKFADMDKNGKLQVNDLVLLTRFVLGLKT